MEFFCASISWKGWATQQTLV